jgi:hypothetical protein
MLKWRFVFCICVLTGCLLSGVGCARSGARGVAPPAVAEQSAGVEQLRAAGEAADAVAPPETAPFHFPNDRGGELLSKVLPPDVPHNPLERAAETRRPTSSGTVESPVLPLPPIPSGMPRLPIAKGNRTLQPRLVLPETLDGSPLEPRFPPMPSLHAGELTHVPSVDVNRPVPLPILGQPLSDRAVIEDVTVEASNAAVVATKMPVRTQPTPFVKNNLPEPFEFRRPVGATGDQIEQPVPPTATPKLPKP